MERNALFFRNRLELDGVVGILTATCGASTIEVLLDMMPTESTDLSGAKRLHLIHNKRENIPGTRRRMA
jgi:hypothetical protein